MHMCGISGWIGDEAASKDWEPLQAPVDPGKIRLEAARKAGALLFAAGGSARILEQTVGGQAYVLAFSGSLCNGPELCRALGRTGWPARKNTDAELVLGSWLQWGVESLNRLRGPFAFALWEARSRRLWLARDQMGMEPMFYWEQGEGVLFASDMPSILSFPGFRPVLDASGAAELLLIGPGRTPGCGVLQGLRELEPGCLLEWQEGTSELHRYWRLTDGPHPMDFEETAQTVRTMVTESVLGYWKSQPDTGAFLSGGLDSGIICAICAGALARHGRKLDSFSVDYRNNDRYFVPGKFQPTSDADYMGILEQELHTAPHRVILTPEQLANGLEEAVLARGFPGMGDVDTSLLEFCGAVGQQVSHVLSGECADELFGGYPWYRDPKIRNQDGFPWAQSTAQRMALLQPRLALELDGPDYIQSRYEQTLTQTDVMPDAAPLERRMKEMMNLNVRWFMQTLLERNHRMSQWKGLRVSVPFCDHRLAQLLYRTPWEMKDHGGCEKGLLRHAMQDLLPRQILMRKKSPYPKTHDPAYLYLMQERMKLLLNRREAPLWELIRPQAAAALLTRQGDWPFYGQLMRTPQTLCYLLQLNFWLEHFGIDLRL